MADKDIIETTPAWDETQPIPLDSAGRPVGADGIPLFGPGREKALADIADQKAADKVAAANAAAKLVNAKNKDA